MSLSRLLLSLALLALPLPIVSPAQEAEPKKPAPGLKVDAAGDPLPAGAVARLGTARFRHQSPVSFVGYSGDGAILITLSGENSLRFWDAKRGKELRRLELKGSSRRALYGISPSILLSGDGKTLAFGIDEGQCTIVDVASGKTRTTFAIPGGGRERFEKGDGTRSQLSHDGKLLLVVHGEIRGGDSKVALWNTETGMNLRDTLPKAKGNSINGATFSRDGKSLICADGSDRFEKKRKDEVASKTQLRFIRLADGQETRSVELPQEAGGDFMLTADGKYLIVRDQREQEVFQIDAVTGKNVRNFNADKSGVLGLELAPDHKSLFVAEFMHIKQYDLKAGTVLRSFPISGGSSDDEAFGRYGRLRSFAMAVSPDGKTLAVPAHGTLAFFDVKTGKSAAVDDGHLGRIDSIAFGPESKQVLTGSGDGTLYLWDVAGSKRVRAFVQKHSPPEDEKRFRRRGGDRLDLFRVRGVFSPDGKSVAGLWWGDKVHIWDAASGKLRHHLGAPGGTTGFSYSPDGRLIALAGGDGTLTLWDAAAGRDIKTFGTAPRRDPNERDSDFEEFEQGAYSLAFSPDGRMLISGGMSIEPKGLKVGVHYWELASGQERMQFRTHVDLGGAGARFDAIISAFDSFIAGLAFSPDGKSVVEAGFASVKLRKLRTGTEIRAFSGNQIAAATVCFSPDGKMLVAGKYDGSLRVWDLASATVLVDFPAHPAHVTALAFSPNGKWLASGARDSGVLLWDWETIRKQALAGKLDAPADKVESLWKDLADKDARKAYSAIKALAAAPAESVPGLKSRMRPIPPVDPKVLKKLIDDLDHPQFSVRRKAEATLEKLGDVAAPAIKERRGLNPPLEMARRLEALQRKLDDQILPQDVLQVLRAIEALELIDNAEARTLVEALSKGAPGHRITEEAREALKRLNPR